MPKLVIQMGHTGRPPNPGSVGTEGEQVFARMVGAECVRLLNRDGWTVALITADPAGTAYRGDAFVAIHCDGSLSPASRGASLGFQTPEGSAFARAVAHAYDALGWTGGWKPDNYTTNLAQYYGVRTAVAQGTRKAFIFETGTLTNSEDRALMHATNGPARVALAIGVALGITTTGDDNDMELTELVDFRPVVGGAPRNLWDVGAQTLHVLGMVQARLDAGFGELSNDEANILAAIRAGDTGILNALRNIPPSGTVDVEALADALIPHIPIGTTPEQLADVIARRMQA